MNGTTQTPSGSEDEGPRLPGFRSWRAVYLLVVGAFVALVVALTIFTRLHA
jgi:hypothetical protein